MPAPSHPAATLLGALLLSAAAVAPALAPAGELTAQEAASPGAGEWLIGGSLGLPMASLEPELLLFTAGLHFLRLPARGPFGFEVSVGTLPAAFFYGGVPLGVRAGVNLPIRLTPERLLIPTAGVSLVAGLGDAGVNSISGFHVGATVARIGGLRAGLTTHWLEVDRRPVWLVEVGFLGL